jgi:hypothetical protein
MEMSFDWNQYRRFFVPKWNEKPSRSYWVVDGDRILAGMSEGKENKEWTGALVSEIGKTLPGKDFVYLQKDRLDQVLTEVMMLPHYPAQLECLRERVLHSKDHRILSKPHFLETKFSGFWRYFLPKKFVLLIQLCDSDQSAEDAEELALIYQDGRLVSCFRPEMHYLKQERRADSLERVRALSERLVLPCFGISALPISWSVIVEDAHPMRRLSGAIFTGKIRGIQIPPTIRILMGLHWFFGL